MLDSSINYIEEDYILGSVSKDYSSYPQQMTDDGSDTSQTYYQMCTMEEIVDKFMSWSPEIVNECSTGYVMHYDSSSYNPTYVQIKNSTSLAVTLFKKTEIVGYKWKYVEGSLACTTNGINTIINQIAITLLDEPDKFFVAYPDRNSVEVVTFGFLTPEEVASKLSRDYPPSKYSMTSGTRKFTISGRLKVTFNIKPGQNNLNPEGNYDFYSEPYYGIVDNYENRSTSKCPFTATFKVVPVYNYVDGTTYKFNGEEGQFPKLKIVGQYEEDKALEDEFTNKYTSKSLVRLRDILGIYNNKKITIRLYNFKLVDGASINISSNCEFYSSMLVSNPQEYVYNMTSETWFDFSISSSQVANYNDYENFHIRYNDKKETFSINSTQTISNVSKDVVIEITANYKKKNCVYISAEEPMQVKFQNYGDNEVIMEEGMTYATAFTDYANNDQVSLRISSSRAVTEYSHYRYSLAYYKNGVLGLHDPSIVDPSVPNPYHEYVWDINNVFVNEDGVDCYYFDKTIDKLNSYDTVYLWLDMKEVFNSHIIKITLHCDVTLLVDGDVKIQKGDSKRTYTVTTTETKQSITISCRDLPTDSQTKGWFYRLGAASTSDVFGNNESATVSATSDDVYVSIYLSTVNVATWELDANSGANVYDNLGKMTLSNGTYHTSPDINNTKIDLTISKNSISFNTDTLMSSGFVFGATSPPLTQSNHDRFNYTWQQYFYGTATSLKDEKTGLSLTSGYRFQKNDLSTADGYSYKLTIRTYKNYVPKKVLLTINNNQNVSSKLINGTNITQDGDPEIISGSSVRYTYTLTGGTTVGFLLSIDPSFLGQYPYMRGKVTTYIDPNSIKTWKNLPEMRFDSTGKYTLQYDLSVFDQFENAEYVLIELYTPVTKVYNYFVKGDGKVTLGVFNGDMSDPMDVSLFPKTANLYPVTTSYEHPTQFKIKIMCDDEDTYSSYSYLYVDNESPLEPISSGVKKFNEFTDANSKHYSTFSPAENDLIENDDGTILSITAIYDSVLYRRFVDRPFVVTKRSVGSRPIFDRTE